MLLTLYDTQIGLSKSVKWPGQVKCPMRSQVSKLNESPSSDGGQMMSTPVGRGVSSGVFNRVTSVPVSIVCMWSCIVVTGTSCNLHQLSGHDMKPSVPPPWCSTSNLQSLVRNSRSQQSYTSVHASSIESSKALMLSIAIWHQVGNSNVGPFSPYSQSWLNMESRMFLPFFGSNA